MIVSTFIAKAEFAISTHYPNWRDGNANGKLICIPPTLDLLKKYIGPIPKGPIKDFVVEEFREFAKRQKSEENVSAMEYGGFDCRKLVVDFDASKYSKHLNEIRQFWAEQLTLDRLRNAINTMALGGFLLLDVDSAAMVDAVIGKFRLTAFIPGNSAEKPHKVNRVCTKVWCGHNKNCGNSETGVDAVFISL